MHDKLPAHVQQAFATMLAEGGREVRDWDGPRWVSTRNGVTINCLGDPEQGTPPHHSDCSGWIAPLLGARECRCPCHDEHRLSFQQACDLVRARLEACQRR